MSDPETPATNSPLTVRATANARPRRRLDELNSEFVELSVVRGAVAVKFKFKSIFDPAQIDQLQTELEKLVHETQAACYVLDMGAVDFISSGFLGLLVSASNTLKGLGSKVRICHLSPGIQRVIKTTHLDRVLDIRLDLEAATADLQAASPARI